MVVPLSKNSDQYVNLIIGSIPYTVRIHWFRGMLYADVSINETDVITGHRILPNTWILPFEYISEKGNFRIETRTPDKNEYPDYEELDGKFKLAYYSATEIAEMESSE